jgi:hypothetical protein
MALVLKGASERSLKIRQNIIKILTVWNFLFLNVIKSKWISSKMNTFARSKDPDPTGSGLEKV